VLGARAAEHAASIALRAARSTDMRAQRWCVPALSMAATHSVNGRAPHANTHMRTLHCVQRQRLVARQLQDGGGYLVVPRVQRHLCDLAVVQGPLAEREE